MSTSSDIAQLREAAFEACRPLKPTRFTSDPDVINNPEATRALQTEWQVYFDAMNDVERRFPYTEEERAFRSRASFAKE